MLKWMSKKLKLQKVNSLLIGKLAYTFASMVTYFSLMGSACLPTSAMPSRVPNGETASSSCLSSVHPAMIIHGRQYKEARGFNR